MKKIIQYGSPNLEKKSEEVNDITSTENQQLIDDMLEILKKKSKMAAGLSAPQVNILKRIAICRRIDLEEGNDSDPIWEIMINPEVVETSKETSTEWEGCLSINYGDLYGRVKRPRSIKVKYLDRDGNKKELTATEYFAHVVGHEIDHLNGVLFIKYVEDPSELYTGKELDEMNR